MSLSLRLSGALDVRWRGEAWGLPERQDTLRLWLALLFREGRTVERESLAAELWPALDREPRASRLRYHLHALQRYLPPVPDEGEGWLHVERSRLAWNPSAALQSDLGALREGLRSIGAALEGGTEAEVEAARRLALDLLALDRGPLLPGFDEPFVEAPRDEMDRLQADLLDGLAELHWIAGRRDAASDRSIGLLRRRPDDERAHRRRMRIAAAELDAAELDARFDEARRAASESRSGSLENLIEPETEALFRALRSWLSRVEHAALEPAPSPVSPSQVSPSPVSIEPTSWTNEAALAALQRSGEALAVEPERVDELGRLESLRALHARARCVTLTGAGGSGKSRLLLALLEGRAEDATIAWSLARVSGAAGLYRGLADRLEIPAGLVLGESAEALDLLAATIGRRKLRLVLDQGEAHAATLAGILAELLRRCPQLRVVLGSRETLRIAEESVWRMPLLTVPRDRSGRTAHGEAMALLERARRDLGQRIGLAERGAMARICMALDGLPVALISAAQALERGSPEALAERLEAQAGFILDRPLPGSKRFGYATLLESHAAELHRLGLRERRLLRGLAALDGAFDLDQARSVGEGLEPPSSPPTGSTWVETLMRLRERSLMEVEVLPDGDYAYRILRPLRDLVSSLPERFFGDEAVSA